MKGTMNSSMIFDDLLEAADKLSIDEQESLLDILYHRITDSRRKEISKEFIKARNEFKMGMAQAATPNEIIRDILKRNSHSFRYNWYT